VSSRHLLSDRRLQPTEPWQLRLLHSIVARRKGELLPLLAALRDRTMVGEEREALRGVVLEELLERGLQAGDEPTAYGLKLEDVIDWLGHV
jgi:hypothetical protein